MRAVFLDRDGVLNDLVERDGRRVSPRQAADFRLREDAAPAVVRLRAAGYGIFVVTNQPDLARGLLEERQLDAMHQVLMASVRPDAIAVCPHDDADACGCRKPRPGMLLDLAHRWSIDLAASVVVGDSWRDVAAGRSAGCRTVAVAAAAVRDLTGAPVAADALVPSLAAAVDWIERGMTGIT